MIVLDGTTKKIQVVLAASVAANQAQCVASWRDVTTTAYTPGSTETVTNNTTDVDLVGAPAASTQRVIDFLNVYNADTAAVTVTVKSDNFGVERILYKATLAPGATLTYTSSSGWMVSADADPGFASKLLFSEGYTRSQDTDATAAGHLGGNTAVGFIPFCLPPRTSVLRGFIGGTTTPTSAGNAGFQVQLYNLDDTSFAPGTMIGSTGSYNIVGSGALLDTTAPPYVGLQAGGNWWAAWTPPSGWENDSYTEPKLVSIGVQIQGSGAFTAGNFYTQVRNILGPAFLKISADQAWAYTFTDSPTVTGQVSGDLEGRPVILLQLEGI